MKEIYTIWKQKGQTPLETIEHFRAENKEYGDVPITYAGRLDPIAEGLLLVLAGAKTKEKEKYLGLEKEYIARILFGFTTDTGDILGISEKMPDTKKIEKDKIEIEVKNLIGKREEKYPAFSSKTLLGKPLWKWAREGKYSEIDVPTHEIEVESAELMNLVEENSKNLLEEIKNTISLVKGDFRQNEILEKWRQNLCGEEKYLVTEVKFYVSGGTYIRTLAERLGNSLGTSGILISLKRTKIKI